MIANTLAKFYTGVQTVVPAGLSYRVVYPVFILVAVLMDRSTDDSRISYVGAGTFEFVEFEPEEMSPERHQKIGELQAMLSIIPMLAFIAPVGYIRFAPDILALILASCWIVLVPFSLRVLGNVTIEVVQS